MNIGDGVGGNDNLDIGPASSWHWQKKAPDDDRGMGKIYSYERCDVEIITPVSSSNTDTDFSMPCCDLGGTG